MEMDKKHKTITTKQKEKNPKKSARNTHLCAQSQIPLNTKLEAITYTQETW